MRQVITKIEELYDAIVEEKKVSDNRTIALNERETIVNNREIATVKKATELAEREKAVSVIEDVAKLRDENEKGRNKLIDSKALHATDKKALADYQVIVKEEYEKKMKELENKIESYNIKEKKLKDELLKEVLQEIVNRSR